MTLRHGDLVDEIGNRHYCEFDDEPHMYFNAGAARIPVPIETYLRIVKSSKSSWRFLLTKTRLRFSRTTTCWAACQFAYRLCYEYARVYGGVYGKGHDRG